MIRASNFNGKRVAVFGLGGSGLASARALMEGGEEVAAWDDSAAGRDSAEKAGIALVDLSAADWSTFAALVLAPGVPLTHPEPHWVVAKARAAGVEIIGDIELFARERAKLCPEAPFIAITGTNGKSTTTALIAHLLRELGCDVQMGGNIGTPILALEPPAPDRFHVIEMSSFQIDLTPTLKPTVGVILNVTPDHIDRHGTVENYAAIKERLAAGAQAVAIGIDDDFTRAMAARVSPPAKLYAFKVGTAASSMTVRLYSADATLYSIDVSEHRVPAVESPGPAKEHFGNGQAISETHVHRLASLEGVRSLRGRHNVQNALAALAAIRALQDRLDAQNRVKPLVVWKPEALQAGLATFPGLAHRMEEMGRLGTIVFINDSKATNADSTEKALASWERGIYWILGGKSKEGGITPLENYFPRVAKAYLIGAATEEFAATLDGKVEFERCGTLDVAVTAAARDAVQNTGKEPVVLLSPACASYDQYKNFEVRGDHFRKLVAALPGVDLGPRSS